MESAIKLSELAIGSEAVVAGFAPGAGSLLRLREMGVLPGTPITLVRRAPLGDPIEISVRGSLISLRLKEADLINVRLESSD